MEPLSAVGLVSSIVQIADASFKIMRLLDTIKEGAKERRMLSDEITLLWMMLRNLETQFVPLSMEKNEAWTKPLECLAEPGGVFEQLRSALNDIMNKLTSTESGFGKAMQTIRWPLTQSYVEKTVAKIERLKSSIVVVSAQANIALAQEMRRDVSAIKNTVDDGHFKEVMNWLSPLNFRQKQENITASPGTGAWFFASGEFESWHTGPDRWFWCYGIPGAGKTFLASNTVNELRRIHKSDGALVLVAFCSFDSADSQSVENLIASLLKQVAQSEMSIPEGVQRLFKKHNVRETRPKLSELSEVLSNVLIRSPKAFIVLDALDELADDSKHTILLDTLFKLKSKPKIMLTSRKLESIANRFGWPLTDGVYCDRCERSGLEAYNNCEDCEDFDYCTDCLEDTGGDGHAFVRKISCIKLRIAAHPEDIENYVNKRIEWEEDLYQIVNRQPELRDQILETIVENAQDMFLLARFHVDLLADCLTPSQLRHALSSLPSGIDATYDNAMARIEKLSKNRQRMVKKLLMWVSYAQRPMSIQELEHATAISRGARDIPLDWIMSAKVLTSLSAGLVIIDENEHVRLTHKTAESYFLDKRSTLFPQGDVEIAECCLAYLQLQEFDTGPCIGPNESDAFDARLASYPFLGYAALYWGRHAQLSQSEIVTPQALLFLRKKNALAACIQTMWHLDRQSYDSWDVPHGVDALHLASYFGLSDIVISLLSDGANPNSQDPFGTTPLIYACMNGHAHVADILLCAGADSSLVDERGSTALHRAVRSGNIEVTKRLVEEAEVGINNFCYTWKYFTPLLIAVENGSAAIVDILLKHPDIDVNLASPSALLNPLLLASETGRCDILKSLLEHPQIDKGYMHEERATTAVHYATIHGHISCLELLLQSGCDPNLHTPIHNAVNDDQLESVQTLLKYGAKTDFVDGFGRNILHAGAVNNCPEILRFLLETGVDVGINDQGNSGETPLHDAVRSGYVDIVCVLLEYGARTDIANASGRSPVRIAMDAGYTLITELLQEARAREQAIHEQSGEVYVRKADTFEITHEQPLNMLVSQGSVESIRLRLAKMSFEEINAPSPDNVGKETALHFACAEQRVDVVNLLLEAGADPNHVDAFERTPLIIACQVGNADVVQALVKHGADINFRGLYHYPWEIALRDGGSKAALFLIAQPEAILESDSEGLTEALEVAAAFGDMGACKRLVDAGAPAHLKNSSGSTPAQTAKGGDHKDVEKYLMEVAAHQLQQLSRNLPELVREVEEQGKQEEE